MEGFSWTISGATIIVAAGWVISIVALVWKRSAAEATAAGRLESAHIKLDEIAGSWKTEKTTFDQNMRQLERDRQAWREQLENEMSQKFGATSGSISLLRDQLAEIRENIAKNYMTKPEIDAIEKRVVDGQGRIIDRLEKIDGRMSSMHEAVLAALKTAR